MVAPAEDALLHAFDVEHAFGEAFAHELLGNVLVVTIEVRHLAGIDELDRVEVFLGLGSEHLKERLLVGLHLELHKVWTRRIEPSKAQLRGAFYFEHALERQEGIAAQPREEHPGVAT